MPRLTSTLPKYRKHSSGKALHPRDEPASELLERIRAAHDTGA
jgi:hypothetical protein